MKIVSTVASVVFMIILVLSLVWAWLHALLSALLELCGLMSRRMGGGYTMMNLQGAWNVAFFLCPWISTRKTERFTENFERVKADQREYLADLDRLLAPDDGGTEMGNLVLLCNHTSFLDTPMFTRLTPARVVFHCRGYVASFLYKMPLFGRIIQAIGHFPVYFTSSQDGKFTVDKERMAKVEEDVEELLVKHRGVLCLFPEGAVNKAPENGLMNFRYGTFAKALQHNFRLWCFTSAGHEKSWPAKASIGGAPARTMIDCWPLAPNGCAQLVKEIREQKLVEGAKDKDDKVLLAEYAQRRMNEEVNKLRATLDMPFTAKATKQE